MKERLAQRLLPEAQEVLRTARRLVGYEPVLKWVDALPHDVRAVLVRPRQPGQRYEIRVVRGQERVLEHLIAHEVGHLARLHRVPPSERLAPVLTPACRRRAAHQIAPELAPIARLGMPPERLADLFTLWYEGLCTQLSVFPADLRIEAWIHARFAGLRPVQRSSLLTEVERALPSFLPEVIAFTPPTIYRATMAMNAAQALQVAQLYDAPEALAPFERAGYEPAARYLLRQALEPTDEGHRSDMAATDRWAQALGLAGWLEWQPPPGFEEASPGTPARPPARHRQKL